MNEIKCPKCGEFFTIDEAGYAAILKQVHDKEFEKELEKIKSQIRDELANQNSNELLYVETPFGSIGSNEIIPNEEVPENNNIRELIEEYNNFKRHNQKDLF